MALTTQQHSFWVEQLTDREDKQLLAFAQALKQKGILVEGFDDRLTLLRFLKARQFNVPKAVKMYQVSRVTEKSARHAQLVEEHRIYTWCTPLYGCYFFWHSRHAVAGQGCPGRACAAAPPPRRPSAHPVLPCAGMRPAPLPRPPSTRPPATPSHPQNMRNWRAGNAVDEWGSSFDFPERAGARTVPACAAQDGQVRPPCVH